MATFIDMPKLSDTMTVGTVANWLKNEGDAIESGDVIAEIETDKATMELEAFEDGILLKQIAKAGEQVAIGAPIAAIGEEGEEVEVPDAPSAPKTSDSSDKKDDEPEKKDEAPAKEEKSESDSSSKKSSDSTTPEGRIKASPLAKKLAAAEGIDLASISGTGPNGRIVKQDVLDAKASGGGKKSSDSSKASSASKSKSAAPVTLPGLAIAEDAELPVSNMRGVIAKRLVDSKVSAPHFYLQIDVNVANLLATRAKINADLANVPAEHGGGIKLTVNDFILKASAEALRRVPAMNRAWQGNTIRQNGSVNLAFGVAIEDGLLTPVIRNAESKTLKQIAIEAKELIGKARSKKLGPNEMTGSTFTVTNLGMYGISSFYGIINTPDAGILSVGATVNKPIVNDAGEIVAGQIMTIGLSCDHRVVDGAVGAEYLQALKTLLETPALSLI
ncbi:dihydrolipoamide acetyltransferase family protein [Pelagicoccus sp. SDUM812003]|uniref:dihydrolipoamide acetyltransferase family protein n=1 Tax=Pelagicoccus sp. SDUM812003 TaxID=3041267 RepID=UPI00280D510F|nr:dihydrolipoamide acetyltransferase family protein [Pelagicoccus sp. SDUM812003]MDQ8204469.1 dihydrolipoamide acetyltransferase family protein [Pelagicoccus sp. SDUM812003]